MIQAAQPQVLPGYKASKPASSNISIYGSKEKASSFLARRIIDLILKRQRQRRNVVLGLATGSSPIPLYQKLVQAYEQGLSFSNVITFNLDEYYPMAPSSKHSYVHFMNEHLFKHIDIPKAQINIPDGRIEENEVEAFCKQYEDKIHQSGGIDLQILGIGRTGHIGFNEPGSSYDSTTRLVELDDITRKDAATEFEVVENVPHKAITMGVKTILKADEVYLMAWGGHKADIVKETIGGKISSDRPASYLQMHHNYHILLDQASGSALTIN